MKTSISQGQRVKFVLSSYTRSNIAKNRNFFFGIVKETKKHRLYIQPVSKKVIDRMGVNMIQVGYDCILPI